MPRSRSHYETTLRVYQAEAEMAYLLDVFGDHLAKTYLLPPDLYGIPAVNYYLMQKHNWTRSQLEQMSSEEKRFALSAEMTGYRLPPEAQFDT